MKSKAMINMLTNWSGMRLVTPSLAIWSPTQCCKGTDQTDDNDGARDEQECQPQVETWRRRGSASFGEYDRFRPGQHGERERRDLEGAAGVFHHVPAARGKPRAKDAKDTACIDGRAHRLPSSAEVRVQTCHSADQDDEHNRKHHEACHNTERLGSGQTGPSDLGRHG